MQPLEVEDVRVKKLLVISHASYNEPTRATVCNDSSETGRGWMMAQPRPVYQLTYPRKRKKNQSKALTGSSKTLLYKTWKDESAFGMGGRLTDDFDYIYDGGLSKRVTVNESLSVKTLSPQHCTTSYITLKPVLVNRSDMLHEGERNDILSRVAHDQMKPDIAYERMIIERQLQKMNLSISSPELEQAKYRPDALIFGSKSKRWNKKKKKLKSFDWSSFNKSQAAFKKEKLEQTSSCPQIRTSFSRLLESSSVAFSYKTAK
jgi:hypothetical protein